MLKPNKPHRSFKLDPNPFKSFFWYLKNGNNRPSKANILGVAIIVILLLVIFFMEPPKGGLRLLLGVIPMFLISYFLAYLGVLRFSPVFKLKKLQILKDKDGFLVEYKNGTQELIRYQDVIGINYKAYPVGASVSSLVSRSLRLFFVFSSHYSIKFRNDQGEKEEIMIPQNITNLLEALNTIVSHIPEEKRGNIRLINGEAIVFFLERKTSLLGLDIDLDTPRGKLIFIILAIITIGIWLFILFSVKKS